jgi:CBS-domain-containing membrane protein
VSVVQDLLKINVRCLFNNGKRIKIMTNKLSQLWKLKCATRDLGRLIWCAMGAATGIGISLEFVDISSSPFLLASVGGSTVFLFGLTRAAAAQPRALFGGHLGGALIGVLCSQAFGDALWVYMLALVLTLTFMLFTKTVHPPAGANPLIMVHEHASLSALWDPVGLSILILALVAVVWSRLGPGMVHYPTKWSDKSPPSVFWGGWNE